jgi:membrane fusion protein, multidrug efflux system
MARSAGVRRGEAVMNARRCRRWGLSPCLPIALFYLAVGCSPQESIRPEVVRPVKTQVVIAGDEPHIRVFPGRVEASTRAELAFQVPGLLVSLPVREGQNVAQGEVIAQLRQDEFQAQLQAAQGQLDQARGALNALRLGERPEERLRREAQVRAAEARLANARAEFERDAQLVQMNAVARADYERAETAYRVAQEDHRAARQVLEQGTIAREEDIEAQEAQVRVLESRVVEASLQLEDSTLRAPYGGVIARRFVDVGQNIRVKEPVVQFQDVEEVDIAVDVPETVMIAALRAADIVQMNAEISGAPGLELPVRIREVAQVADPMTQTFQIRVAMQSPPGMNVLPGMTARVTLAYRRASILGDRLLVPISAVSKDAMGEPVAWVVGPDQTVSRRPVKLGEATGGRIEIVEGLQPGDRIAVAGVTFLRDGMQVPDLGDALGRGRS